MHAMLKTGPGNIDIIEKPVSTSNSPIRCSRESSVRMKGITEAPPPKMIEPILKNLSIKLKFIEND